jgi:hypothetical protein
MPICILPYHQRPSDIKLCLAFFIVPTNDLGLSLVMEMLNNLDIYNMFIYLVQGV